MALDAAHYQISLIFPGNLLLPYPAPVSFILKPPTWNLVSSRHSVHSRHYIPNFVDPCSRMKDLDTQNFRELCISPCLRLIRPYSPAYKGWP